MLTRALKHKKKKREIEANLIIQHIGHFINEHVEFFTGGLDILEFGSGSGYQLKYLSKLGNVVGSDINVNEDVIDFLKNDKFVKCNVSAMPFVKKHFDVIFSNHVIEHIKELEKGFSELKRLGKEHCLYAFSVPTNIWLLLSIPGQYYLKAVGLRSRKPYNSNTDFTVGNHTNRMITSDNDIRKNGIEKLLPHGHGVIRKFVTCYISFKIKSWKELFQRNNFVIQKMYPLLLYSPSSLPIIPTTYRFNRFGLSSSVLFVMQTKL